MKKTSTRAIIFCGYKNKYGSYWTNRIPSRSKDTERRRWHLVAFLPNTPIRRNFADTIPYSTCLQITYGNILISKLMSNKNILCCVVPVELRKHFSWSLIRKMVLESYSLDTACSIILKTFTRKDKETIDTITALCLNDCPSSEHIHYFNISSFNNIINFP